MHADPNLLPAGDLLHPDGGVRGWKKRSSRLLKIATTFSDQNAREGEKKSAQA
jgi:hypothetical protein